VPPSRLTTERHDYRLNDSQALLTSSFRAEPFAAGRCRRWTPFPVVSDPPNAGDLAGSARLAHPTRPARPRPPRRTAVQKNIAEVERLFAAR
jgi:hypothetical protein